MGYAHRGCGSDEFEFSVVIERRALARNRF